jgi:hypothetical protein
MSDKLQRSGDGALAWHQESYVLAAIMESLIEQDAPDSVSGYKLMDAVRKVFEDQPWAAAPSESTHKAERDEALKHVLTHHYRQGTDLVGWFGTCSCGGQGREPVDFENEEEYVEHIFKELAFWSKHLAERRANPEGQSKGDKSE